MNLSPSRRARACLGSLAGAALLAAVLPLGVATADEPTPTSTAPASARPVLKAPALLGPVSPADRPQPVLKDVLLAWAAVPGALGYRVQVGQDGEFSDDEVTLDLDSTATSLALPGWLPNAAYRWRVAAKQAVGHGYWSGAGAFTKGWRDRPTGLLTDSGPSGRELPVFSWDPVSGASEYELQVSPDPSFAVDPTQVQAGFDTRACFTTRTRVTPANEQGQPRNDAAGDCDFSNLAPGELRYWRVRALDHLVDDAKEVDTTPVVRNGISYQPTPPKSGDLDEGACPVPPGTAPSASPSASPGATPSPAASPSGTPSPVPAPTVTPSATPSGAPDGGLSCDPAHTVQRSAWSATSVVVWTPPALYAEPTSATYLPLPVQAPSATHCTPAAAVPGEGRLSDCVEFPTLDWEPRAGATSYRLYIALDDAFTNVHQVVETYATQWTPTTVYRDTTASQSYYYAVQACSPVRCGAVSPTPDSFRKKGPRTVLTAPAAATASGAGDVQLRWTPFSVTQGAALAARTAGARATAEAYAYRVQVAEAPEDGSPATDADFQAPLEDVVVDGTVCRPAAVPATSTVDPRTTSRAVQSCSGAGGYATHDASLDQVAHVPSKRLATGSYAWRVQALDASGHRLAWSAPSTFTRDVTPPTAALSVSASTVDAVFRVRFSEPVTGLSATTVQVPAGGVLAVAADRRALTVRPATTWVPGRSYTLRLLAGVTDAVGNPLAPSSRVLAVDKVVDDGSRAVRYAGAWGFRSSSNAVGGGFRVSRPVPTAPTAASVTVHGAGVLVTGCLGPAGGLADVYVDGVKRVRVDTYRSYSGCGVRLARLALPAGDHRVQVRGVGQKRAASRGTSVMLDAVTAL